MEHVDEDRLVALRRALHEGPEPAWCEFATTARLVAELESIGVDESYVGPDALDPGARMAVPDDEELDRWLRRARETDADPAVLDRLEGGHTGAVAVLEGERQGPTVALRVDIDGLPITESADDDHAPAAGGFRSRNEGWMHACGHDAHATIGIGVLEAFSDRAFPGRLKVIFQPAEEVIGGAAAVAESGHLDDVDSLLAIHVGLGHPTGEVVAGVTDILAVTQFRAEFAGESAHAGGYPAEGRNAVQAMTTAVQNLYAIPRHEDGVTRVNAGKVGGGTATNIIPESAHIEGEVRGETTDLMEYVFERADRVIDHAAAMHDCEATLEVTAEAPSADSDPAVVDAVERAARGSSGVESVLRHAPLGGSEDATYLMRRVQDRGGEAAFVCLGTDHPGGHHTPTFDVDEATLPIAVETLAGAIRELQSRE